MTDTCGCFSYSKDSWWKVALTANWHWYMGSARLKLGVVKFHSSRARLSWLLCFGVFFPCPHHNFHVIAVSPWWLSWAGCSICILKNAGRDFTGNVIIGVLILRFLFELWHYINVKCGFLATRKKIIICQDTLWKLVVDIALRFILRIQPHP